MRIKLSTIRQDTNSTVIETMKSMLSSGTNPAEIEKFIRFDYEQARHTAMNEALRQSNPPRELKQKWDKLKKLAGSIFKRKSKLAQGIIKEDGSIVYGKEAYELMTERYKSITNLATTTSRYILNGQVNTKLAEPNPKEQRHELRLHTR